MNDKEFYNKLDLLLGSLVERTIYGTGMDLYLEVVNELQKRLKDGEEWK